MRGESWANKFIVLSSGIGIIKFIEIRNGQTGEYKFKKAVKYYKMTYLINCYGNIEADLMKLRISDSRTSLDDDEFELERKQLTSTKQIIMGCVDKTNLKYCNLEENIEAGLLEITGFYDQLFNFHFDLFCKVQFFFHSYQITIFTTLTRNFVPFRVNNKNHRLMVSKFVLKTNAAMKYGSFRIDPSNGELTLCFNSIMTAFQFQDLIDRPSKLTEFLEQQFLKSKYFYRIYIFKILYLINEVTENYTQDPELLNIKIKTISTSYKQTQEIINKITPTMHMEFPFFYSEHAYTGVKQLSMDQAKRMNQTIKASKAFKKPLSNYMTKITKMVTSTHNGNSGKGEDGFSEENKKEFVSKLMEPIVRYQTGELPNVYSEIEIVNSPNSWQVIDQGGFGVILKGWVRFAFKEHLNQVNPNVNPNHHPNNLVNLFTRQIVKKEDHDPEAKKLCHQKKILQSLRNSSSPFIAKFYFSQQPDYKNCLLIEYCYQKSLSLLKLRNSQFLSLSSKLTYLKHLAQGLKFLKDHEICHLDIKPSNLLFSSGLIKITDFGEAYHPEVCAINFRPGTSIPYAPPESFAPGHIKFNNKLDVFSFGVVMYELLFESYPFDYTRTKYQIFRKAYFQKNYSSLIYQAPEKVLREGFSGICYLLKFVALKCLDQDERKRPCIEWIVITLQYCINLQQQLYI